MKVFFIRHAESIKNIGEKFDKDYDHNDQLTSQGEEEIMPLVKFLNQMVVNKSHSIFITGNRTRVIETTKRISKLLSCEYFVSEELIPINPGSLSGLTYDEAFEKFPELMQTRKLFVQNQFSGYDVVFPNGDLFKDYETKIKNVFNEIILKYAMYETIFIITHRSVILAALNIYNKILGLQELDLYKYYPTNNGYVAEIMFESNQPISLISHGGINEWNANK